MSMWKRILNAMSIVAVLGIAYSDELPFGLSLSAALFLAVEAFITAPAGIDCARRHKLFRWQVTELGLFVFIGALALVGALVTWPSLGCWFILAVLCSGGCGFLLSVRRPTWFGR